MSQHIAQLVTIATVEKHPNADSLELITFQEIGWSCIDKIGIRKPGDRVVYVPVDSLVDVTRPEFSFLAKDARADNKARIKTIRLRGIISQGLVVNIPNGIDPEVDENGTFHYTTALGVEKYVPADEDSLKSNLLIGNAKGRFPECFYVSDAERFQNCFRTLENAGVLSNDWFWSLKLDGTSFTAFYDVDRVGDEFGVCSRKLELYRPGTLIRTIDTPEGSKDIIAGTSEHWEIAIKYDIENVLKELVYFFKFNKIAIQGEIVGEGIQSNRLGLKGKHFFAFDIQYINDKNELVQWMSYDGFIKACTGYSIPHVPVLKIAPLPNNVQELVDYVNQQKYDNGFPAEGVVFVEANNTQVLRMPQGNRAKFKIISQEFELATGKK